MTIDNDPNRSPAPSAEDDDITRLILEGLREGATVADLKGVSRDALEGVYAIAHRYYENGQLDEAEAFFRFLCLYDFYNAEYALGMGAVLHLKREYDKAIGMYAVAQTLDLTDDRPMFHVGQCHLALGRLDNARECFESVATRATGKELGTRSEAYLRVLQDAPQAPATDGEQSQQEA